MQKIVQIQNWFIKITYLKRKLKITFETFSKIQKKSLKKELN